MQRLLHRRQRLSSLLRSLYHPRITSVRVGDAIVPLPLRLPFKYPLKEEGTSFSQESLEWLSYAFSVFGSITPYTSCSGFSLTITTRLTRAAIPIEFCKAFGGTAYFDKVGKGVSLPNVSWKVHGPHAVQIARFLQKLSPKSRKQGLLDIAANWPIGKRERFFAAKDLRDARLLLRKHFFKNGAVESWRDLVELFDSRGHTKLCGSIIRLTISHQNTSLLKSISNFLLKEGVITGKSGKGVYCYKPIKSYWSCHKTSSVKLVSQALLKHGLVYQRPRIIAALRFLSEFDRGSTIKSTSFVKSLPDETNSMKYRKASRLESLCRELRLDFCSTKSTSTMDIRRKQKIRKVLWTQQEISKLKSILKEMRVDTRQLLRRIQEEV